MDELDVQQRARQFIAPLDIRNVRDDLSVYVKAANAVLLKEELGHGESKLKLAKKRFQMKFTSFRDIL